VPRVLHYFDMERRPEPVFFFDTWQTDPADTPRQTLEKSKPSLLSLSLLCIIFGAAFRGYVTSIYISLVIMRYSTTRQSHISVIISGYPAIGNVGSLCSAYVYRLVIDRSMPDACPSFLCGPFTPAPPSRPPCLDRRVTLAGTLTRPELNRLESDWDPD
jgi:hypothetical protein